MIRDITPDDTEFIIDCLYLLKDESPRYGHLEAHEDYVRGFISSLPERENFIGKIDEEQRGFMFGGTAPTWYSPRLNAYEELLYVLPGARGGTLATRLIKAFVSEADRRGAYEVMVGVSTGINEDRTLKLYERLGFEWYGRNLIKTLRIV